MHIFCKENSDFCGTYGRYLNLLPVAVNVWDPESTGFVINRSGCLIRIYYSEIQIQILDKKSGLKEVIILILVFSIVADPGSLSRIRIFFPSQIHRKEFKNFKPKSCVLSSRKYDPGCTPRFRILIFLPIPDPGSKYPGSAPLVFS